MHDSANNTAGLPPRFRSPPAWTWLALVVLLAAFVHGVWASGLTPAALWQGLPKVVDFVGRAFPPSTERLDAIAAATLETFEMAVVGTTFGVLLSLPLAFAAASNTTPHRVFYAAARAMIAVMRAIPDIVWALLFIVFVGLGPKAGILAIAVDTMGFCGRFFAERVEEVDMSLLEALRSTGSSETGVIASGILPTVMPSFVATTMFNLEQQVRTATALGIVGAGGIGVELSTAMTLFRYEEALTIIIVMFGIVITVERVSSMIRTQLIGR